MSVKLFNYISDKLTFNIKSTLPIHGGDISKAYLINTPNQQLFLKVNYTTNAFNMFCAEKYGLELIAETKTIATPEVFFCETYEDCSFILMQYIESKKPSVKDFKKLGIRLADFHNIQNKYFGLKNDNFIGNLYQSNNIKMDWATFYIEERLVPQFRLAVSEKKIDKNKIPEREQLYHVCNKYFIDIKPTILHGDLWSGNFLISSEGIPFLIDPSIYYGDKDVDIAMTKLFGGFSQSFYEAYIQHQPINEYYAQRIDLYQLYYLLVHLNIFGESYYNSVIEIINKYW
ncbi:MAG: fructosamine kinase family protein [Saprospiraceae bacterium]|nr:fructosamine kinase family protein [Saprospiraceae bacterium]